MRDQYAEYDDYDDEFDETPAPAEFDLPFDATNITFSLTRKDGETIKDLIRAIYPHTFPNYCIKVGVRPPNFYNVMNGERPCTLEFLNKILSGIGYIAELSNPVLHIQELETGQVVNAADLVLQENESQLSDVGVPKDTPKSCSSEKLQENSKTKQDTPSLESPEESLKPSSPTSHTNSNTQLPTEWDVDL
jgi:hypothetical protein